ncbi:MAG: helix-turn-helix transcriptional regulator [Paenibacillaceae bacterium]|nr:helix-turn-helix transcriptional regulator [Paenibacillaceae bacterium]
MKALPLLRRKTLFFKLLTGFVCVILLVISFNLFSYSFFKRNIEMSIIRNNQQNLNNTVDRYENHIRLIQSTVIRLYFDERVVMLNDLGIVNYIETVNQLVGDMKNMLANDQMYLNDIWLHFRNRSYVIDKNGPSAASQFFSRSFSSPRYDETFWREQFEQPYQIKVLEEASFTDTYSNRSVVSLIPVVLKNDIYPDLYITALLEPDKVYEAYRNSNQEQFYLLDAANKQLFASVPELVPADIPGQLTEGESYVKKNNRLYFYKKGALTGMTYLAVVPLENITAQVSRLNAILIAVLAAAILLSVLISIIMSLKFQSPVQQMIAAIRRFHPASPLKSKIKEFNLIYEEIQSMIRHNQEINVDLDRKRSELRQLDYMYKLKNINGRQTTGEEAEQKPFYLILFHLTMTREFRDLTGPEQDAAVSGVRETIAAAIAADYADAVTLQTEKDHLLTLIFEGERLEGLSAAIGRIRQALREAALPIVVTVAYSPEQQQPDAFNYAYEQTLEMVKRRKLGSEPQTITGLLPEPPLPGFTSAQEQEFHVFLQAGNAVSAHRILARLLAQMDNADASANQYAEFAKEIVGKVLKHLIGANVDISTVFDRSSPYQRMQECTSSRQFADCFEWLLTEAAQLLAEQKEGHHPVKHFMLEYIHTNYYEDLSLEMVADRMNMSANYFSTYFKEKTGVNFTDYLTELRIMKAKQLLLHSGQRIQDIAEQVGYLNANSFTRMFKKVTGITPGEYKRVYLVTEKR